MELADCPDCPYCRRPLRDTGAHGRHPGRGVPHADVDAGFVDPDYFRMLRDAATGAPVASRLPSSRSGSWTRSIEGDDGRRDSSPLPEAGRVGSTAAVPPASQHGISAAALSPDYFKRFFVEEGELGRGGKGVVLLVKHVLDGVFLGHFACKRVPVGDDHEWLEKVLVEVQLLQHLSHQNLVSYRHVWLEDVQLTKFGPSVPCAFILQQYCNGGDLHRYVSRPSRSASSTAEQLKDQLRRRSRGQLDPPENLDGPRRLPFDVIYSFFKDIASGLKYLHEKGYIHRDLKASNCLLHDTGKGVRVLVSDFGEAQMESAARKSTGATGTVSYCAPEVLRPQYPGGPLGEFTARSDIFSLGMILYFMCFGRLPYDNADHIEEQNEDVERLKAEISVWPGFDDQTRERTDLPDKLYTFLKRLLSLVPSERPSAEEILWGISTGSGLDDSQPLPTNHDAQGLPTPTTNFFDNSVGAGASGPGVSAPRLISPVEKSSSPTTPSSRSGGRWSGNLRSAAGAETKQITLGSSSPSSSSIKGIASATTMTTTSNSTSTAAAAGTGPSELRNSSDRNWEEAGPEGRRPRRRSRRRRRRRRRSPTDSLSPTDNDDDNDDDHNDYDDDDQENNASHPLLSPPTQKTSLILHPSPSSSSSLASRPLSTNTTTTIGPLHLLLTHPQPILLFKLLPFLLKLLSLTLPCAPLAPNPWIFYPLIYLAAVDLLLPVGRPRWSIITALLHAVVLGLTAAVSGGGGGNGSGTAAAGPSSLLSSLSWPWDGAGRGLCGRVGSG